MSLPIFEAEKQLKKIVQIGLAFLLPFYTYNQLSSKYEGNTKFAGVGRNVTYVIKPESSLFKNLKVDYVELAKEFGAVFKGKTIDVDPEATRTTYKTLSTGSG